MINKTYFIGRMTDYSSDVDSLILPQGNSLDQIFDK